MKPSAFEYERPDSVAEAVTLLSQGGNAKLLAGGQTLGPMLNLRLTQPDLIIDITRIPELTQIDASTDHVTLGACVTHAAIEDGRVEDFTGGLLPNVARGIAYRAVRNRGTLGGSIAHADPSADWLSCFMALDAVILISGPDGTREIAISEFVRGALDCDLADDEIVTAIRLPRLLREARYGYAKICRKEGEFADAIGVYISGGGDERARIVSGATGGRPLMIDADGIGPGADPAALVERLRSAGYTADDYDVQIHAVAIFRAIRKAHAA